MDIYSYINSCDVAEYCRKINKTWTTFEMAFIIDRSNRPLSHKQIAWCELITDYPDMSAPKNMHNVEFDSLHIELDKLIDYNEHKIAFFNTQEAGAVYTYKVLVKRENKYRYSDTVFTSFEKTMGDINNSWERNEVTEITITKSFIDDIDNDKGNMEAYLDYDGNIYYVLGYYPDLVSEDEIIELDLFYVDIPVPFKCGDILTTKDDSEDNSNIFILDSLISDDPRLYARALNGEGSDASDMSGWGLFIDDGGVLYREHTGGHDYFRYYHGKLEGKERLLHYVSLYLQGEKDEIGLSELLAVQCRLMLENQLDNKLRIDIHGRYIDELYLAENRFTEDITVDNE